MFRSLAFALALCCALPLTAEEDPARFEQLESVQAFDGLMRTVAELRATVLADARTEREVAEGMRFILRTLAMSQDVSGDGFPQAPHFARMDTRRRKIGGDNPDAEYDNVVWNGNFDYKITGHRGGVDHLSFQFLSVQPGGRQKSIGYLNERTIATDEEGRFTIWLTREKPEGAENWIPGGPEAGAGTLLVRQYLGSRDEPLAEYDIEVVGRAPFAPLPPSTDQEIARAIQFTGHALKGIGLLHRYVSPALGEDPNGFKLRNSDDFGADISSSDNLYVIGTYDFGPDEALLIEVEPLADTRFWNLAIENPWHESVDYRKRKTSRTHEDVVVDADGKVRFLLAHARSDHPNYLETAGHQRGFMTFRWVGERDAQPPLPTVERLSIADAIERGKKLQNAR
ncbi:MAG: DUF1214 domain-containing protein [Myxococcota bacterium]